MRSVLLLYCILAAGSYFTDGQHWISNEIETINVNHRFSAGECKAEAMKLQKDTRCKPRPRLIRLTSSLGETITPSMVEVHRCEGSCSYHGHTCMGKENRTIEIPVSYRVRGERRPVCGVIAVEEHVTCGCGCPIGPEDCNEKQVFMTENCSCQCRNRNEEKMKCELMGRRWQDVSCSCQCAREIPCSSGAHFVHALCKCMRFMDTDN